MALPTFFIIGAPKAGTTSLHYYLDQHPQIQMSVNKEPRFFAVPEEGIPYAPSRIDRIEDYERLFDPTVRVRGEASTDYSIHPRRKGVPERIKELVPGAQFLYVVRDPMARTISHYQMRVALMGERRSLQEALRDLTDPSSPYIWPSLYASQLELYLRSFPQERIMVIDQAVLLAQRRSTLREIFTFLSVDSTVDSSRFDEILWSSREWRAYSPTYLRLAEHATAPLQWIPHNVRRSLRHVVERVLCPPLETPTLDDAVLAELNELYAREVERLRSLTGKSFATWDF